MLKLIIDGNNLAYRAHATTNLTTKSGENVSAIYGTLNSLQSFLRKSSSGWKNKLLTEVQEALLDRTKTFSEIVVCWDGGKSKWRRNIYPDYKGQRAVKRASQTEEERNSYYQMLDQMETLHQMLPHFGVKSLKVKDWEADDLIYLSTKLSNEDDICIVVSTDRDMLQLVSEKVFVWSPFKEVLYTPKNFAKETGVSKQYYLTYRILVGDKSDNINGIHGIGDKKAKDLIIKYGDIRGIQSQGETLRKSVVTERILDNPDLINRNEKLMDMTKIPIEQIEQEVKETLEKDVSYERDIVKMFLMSKQFISILKDFTVWGSSFESLNK